MKIQKFYKKIISHLTFLLLFGFTTSFIYAEIQNEACEQKSADTHQLDNHEILDIVVQQHGISITPELIAWLGGYVQWCTSQGLHPIEFFNHLQTAAVELTNLKKYCAEKNISYTTATDLFAKSPVDSNNAFKNNMQRFGCMAIGGGIVGIGAHYQNAIRQHTATSIKFVGHTIGQSNALELLAELPRTLNLPITQEMPLKIALHSVLEIGLHHTLSSEYMRKEAPIYLEESEPQMSFLQKIFPADPLIAKIQKPKQFIYENAAQPAKKDCFWLSAKSAIHHCEKPVTTYITNKISEKKLNKELKLKGFVVLSTNDIAQLAVNSSIELLKYECMRNLSTNLQKDDIDATKLPELKTTTALYLVAHKTTSKATENILLQAYHEYARPLIAHELTYNLDRLTQAAAPWVAAMCTTHCFNIANYMGTRAVAHLNGMRST